MHWYKKKKSIRMRVVTEDTYRYPKCSLKHLGLQHNVLLPPHSWYFKELQRTRSCKWPGGHPLWPVWAHTRERLKMMAGELMAGSHVRRASTAQLSLSWNKACFMTASPVFYFMLEYMQQGVLQRCLCLNEIEMQEGKIRYEEPWKQGNCIQMF